MNGKRILFFAPDFFGYEKEIKKKLEQMGAIVDFYDDRPSNSTLSKSMIRINPKLNALQIHNYFKKVIKEKGDIDYDYIFFIKCEAALKKDLDLLKNTFSKSVFILYLYDSIKNISFYKMKEKYFDYIYSFDLDDVKSNSSVEFLPLFYMDCYKKRGLNKDKKNYDLSFIGSTHSDRPNIVNKIRKQLQESGKKYYFQLYIPSKIIYRMNILCNKDFRELNKAGCITLNKINSDTVSRIISESGTIIDIQHPNQSGLTMRTIELIGMEKKIVTTNKQVVEYDFYNSNNIKVVDRKNVQLDDKFLNSDYEKIPKKIYDSYSIDSWIKNIFKY